MSAARAKPGKLRLPEDLDLCAAEALIASFNEKRGAPLSVDASRVKRLSTPCAQVLLSAVATWKADDLDLYFVKPSSELTEAVRRLGIGPADLMIEGGAS